MLAIRRLSRGMAPERQVGDDRDERERRRVGRTLWWSDGAGLVRRTGWGADSLCRSLL